MAHHLAPRLAHLTKPAQIVPYEPEIIESVSMSIEREIREKPAWADNMWVEYEPTGHIFGTIEATISNPRASLSDLMHGPGVFKWPEHEMYVLLLVKQASESVECGVHTLRFAGDVLRVARYGGPERLPEAQAIKQLTA